MFFSRLCGEDMPQKASVPRLDIILMILKHTFLQSQLFIAVLHTVTIELLSMCCQVPPVSSNPIGRTWSGLGPRVPPLPSLPSAFPSAHPTSSPALWLSWGVDRWFYPKETVPLQGTTCPSLATFPSLVLILFKFLALQLKGRRTFSASLSLERLGHSAS